MLRILTTGTQVWEKGAALASPWRVVGQGRHGIICRRSEGSNITTRCFKPDELRRTGESALELANLDLVEMAQGEQGRG